MGLRKLMGLYLLDSFVGFVGFADLFAGELKV
jgi:hypothetical protein